MLPGMNNTPNNPLMNKNPQQNTNSEIIDRIDRFELWFALAWKWLLRLSIVIIIVILVVYGVIWTTRKNQHAAAREIYATTTNTALSGTARIETLEKMIADNARSEAAIQPRFTLAKELIKSGKTAEAIALYNEIAELPNAEDFIQLRAMVNAGNAYEIAGNVDSAIAAYEKVVTRLADIDNNPSVENMLLVEALYSQARLFHDRGQEKEARAKLDVIIAKPVYRQMAYTMVYVDLIQRLNDQVVVPPEPAPAAIPAGIGADMSKFKTPAAKTEAKTAEPAAENAPAPAPETEKQN